MGKLISRRGSTTSRQTGLLIQSLTCREGASPAARPGPRLRAWAHPAQPMLPRSLVSGIRRLRSKSLHPSRPGQLSDCVSLVRQPPGCSSGLSPGGDSPARPSSLHSSLLSTWKTPALGSRLMGPCTTLPGASLLVPVPEAAAVCKPSYFPISPRAPACLPREPLLQ